MICINDALLLKLGWGVLTRRDDLWVTVLHDNDSTLWKHNFGYAFLKILDMLWVMGSLLSSGRIISLRMRGALKGGALLMQASRCNSEWCAIL